MKKLLLAVLLLLVALDGFTWLSGWPEHRFKTKARAASGAVFLEGIFECSGTAIGGGYVLTARHCAVDEANNFLAPLSVSFAANEKGPYYIAKLYLISQADDLAVLKITNGEDLSCIGIGDENATAPGDWILNYGFPLDTGKQEIHGRFIAPNFAHRPDSLKEQPGWILGMPVDIIAQPGQSGSGLFDPKQRKLIGVIVGGAMDSNYSVAVPATRVWELLKHAAENSPSAYSQKFPPRDEF